MQAHEERSTKALQKGTANNFPKHQLRRHCLYVAEAALEETVLRAGSTFSVARMARQYKKQIFKARLNFPLQTLSSSLPVPQQNNGAQQALPGADSLPAFRASTVFSFHLTLKQQCCGHGVPRQCLWVKRTDFPFGRGFARCLQQRASALPSRGALE